MQASHIDHPHDGIRAIVEEGGVMQGLSRSEKRAGRIVYLVNMAGVQSIAPRAARRPIVIGQRDAVRIIAIDREEEITDIQPHANIPKRMQSRIIEVSADVYSESTRAGSNLDALCIELYFIADHVGVAGDVEKIGNQGRCAPYFCRSKAQENPDLHASHVTFEHAMGAQKC